MVSRRSSRSTRRSILVTLQSTCRSDRCNQPKRQCHHQCKNKKPIRSKVMPTLEALCAHPCLIEPCRPVARKAPPARNLFFLLPTIPPSPTCPLQTRRPTLVPIEAHQAVAASTVAEAAEMALLPCRTLLTTMATTRLITGMDMLAVEESSLIRRAAARGTSVDLMVASNATEAHRREQNAAESKSVHLSIANQPSQVKSSVVQ